MSRIDRDRVVPGETTDAATLNSTYADYTQTAALDESNTRDQAFDLPHFTNVPLIHNTKTALLGNAGMVHTTTPTTVASSTVSPGHHVVQNSGGTNTFLDFSSTPWSVTTDDVLRVWWNLSVITTYTGSPWNGASAKGRYTIDDTAAGTVVLSDGMHCWLAYLEWDTTNATLTNWEPVTGQQAPTGVIGSDTGVQLQHLAGASVISPWNITSFAYAVEGEMPPAAQGTGVDHGWFGHYGMYVVAPTSNVTVYGLRLVLTGLMHPAHLSTGDDENALVFDYNVAGTLKYIGGRLTAVNMREG